METAPALGETRLCRGLLSDGLDKVKTVHREPAPSGGPIADFVQLYAKEYTRLVRFAYLLVGDADVGEEIVQEVFVKVFRCWVGIRDHQLPAAFVARAVVNGCRAHDRSKARPRHPGVSTLRLVERDVVDEVVLRADHRDVLEALRRLSGRQRECVAAQYLLEMTEGEAACILGLSIGAARTHTKRGLRSLHKSLRTR